MNGLDGLFVFGLAFLGIVLFDAAMDDLATARRLRAAARDERAGADVILAQARAYYADAQATLATAQAVARGHPAAATMTAALPVLIGPDHERGIE